MEKFVLFCKSFRDDVLRAKRLIESIPPNNADKIPFYLSVPKGDLDLFKATLPFEKLNQLGRGVLHLITDEEIILANPKSTLEDYYQMRGYLHQQVVKSEVWRYLGCENYLCLDSDAYFTKPFKLTNFIHDDGHPYSLMHDSHELLDLAQKLNKPKVLEFFLNDSKRLKDEFGREGPDYDFGPPPMIWSSKVWQTLDEKYLQPRGERLWEAIERHPMEIRWYGEALVKFQPIPIHPIEPLFTFYHHEWQYLESLKNQEMRDIEEFRIGIVKQSFWESELQPKFAQKSLASRTWKKWKSHLKHLITF